MVVLDLNFIMDLIVRSLKKIYINLFFLNPKLLSTILFIPVLYMLGWVLVTPIILLGVDKESLSLIGTIITFLIFLFLLPKWFEIRWGLENTWKLLGLTRIESNKKSQIFYFFKGFLLSAILISLILTPIIGTQWGYWIGKISPDIMINAIFLLLGVGLAEELVFRGWLLEELKNQFGLKKAIIAQAFIFSTVHIGFDLPLLQMISILTGLFFLGILLALLRLKDNNSLWGCIGLHGGLVGLWFITNNGLLFISKDSPKWLVGPGSVNTNPLGGLFGISIMIIFCFLYYRCMKQKI
tara:strand:+ start:1237 stop:2124 length:888 start_codon:yes stop_codon:yes gene_type:complete